MLREVDWDVLTRKLIELREESGLTQGEMAKQIGITPVYYGDWERGKPRPGVLNIIYSLADYHQVSAAWLIGQTALRQIPRVPFILTEESEQLLQVVDTLPLNLRRAFLKLVTEFASVVRETNDIKLDMARKNDAMVDLLYRLICTTDNQSMIREADRLLGIYHQQTSAADNLVSSPAVGDGAAAGGDVGVVAGAL